METIIKKITHTEEDKKIYEQAGQILRAGGLVAFPTETVYGPVSYTHLTLPTNSRV